MEISQALDNNRRSTAKYAVISGMELTIREEPYYVIPNSSWDDSISLKDVEYNIVEGVLYVKGTRIYHYCTSHLLDLINVWGKRCLFKIKHDRNNRLAEPLKEEDIVIKRWWRENKVVRGIDLTYKEVPTWHLLKEEYPYEIAISNFKLREI